MQDPLSKSFGYLVAVILQGKKTHNMSIRLSSLTSQREGLKTRRDAAQYHFTPKTEVND